MAYNTKYIITSSNELNTVLEVYLDFLDYDGVIMPITSAVNGLTLRCVTGDEDRFSPILGTECLISIFVGISSSPAGIVDDSQLTIYDLIAQQDNQIRVTVYKDQDHSKSIFQGFVVVEDNSQPFLDPPFTLSIRALDGLGLLKGVDLVDANGDQFAGAFTPIQWLGQILFKTDQTLNIRGYFNIININFAGFDPLNGFTIPVSTFLSGQPQSTQDPTVDIAATEADDCYTALEKFVRCMRCRLFQQDGVWNLVSIWEYQNPNGYSYIEYALSGPTAGLISTTPVARLSNQNYDVNVGSDQIIHPVTDDAIISLKLATKSVKLNYTYDQSLNKICNQQLTQGNRNATYDGTMVSTVYDPTINPVVTFNTRGFDAFCFNHFDTNSLGGPFPSISPTTRGYIEEIDDLLSNPVDRFLVISEPAGNLRSYFVASQLIIDQGDIFQLSFSWRTKNNQHTGSPATYTVAWVLLYGDDGTFWSLRCLADGAIPGNPTTWEPCADATFTSSGLIDSPEVTDTNAWVQVGVNQNPTISNIGSLRVPVSGNIQVIFQLLNTVPGSGEYWFKNITMSILPYLQGSYVQLTGDFNFSSSNQNIKQTESDTVEISDSPKRYFKGAILQPDGKSLQQPTWIRNGFSGVGQRFTQLMEQIMYNALYRQFQEIQGTMRGLTWVDKDFNVRQVGFLNSYFFTNHPVPTKKFMLTSYEDDYTTGQGSRVFVEILNDQNDNGQVNPDDYIFQRLYQTSQ